MQQLWQQSHLEQLSTSMAALEVKAEEKLSLPPELIYLVLKHHLPLTKRASLDDGWNTRLSSREFRTARLLSQSVKQYAHRRCPCAVDALAASIVQAALLRRDPNALQEMLHEGGVVREATRLALIRYPSSFCQKEVVAGQQWVTGPNAVLALSSTLETLEISLPSFLVGNHLKDKLEAQQLKTADVLRLFDAEQLVDLSLANSSALMRFKLDGPSPFATLRKVGSTRRLRDMSSFVDWPLQLPAQLASLSLTRLGLTSVSGLHLDHLRCLTILDLSGNHLGPENGPLLAAVEGNGVLQKLDLTSNRLGNQGLANLASGAAPLELLFIAGNSATQIAIAGQHTLRELDVSSNPITDPGLLSLDTNRSIERLWIMGSNLAAFSFGLRPNETLRSIRLDRSFVGRAHLQQLGDDLDGNFALQELHLSHCKISDSEISSFHLDGNLGLRRLILSENAFSDVGFRQRIFNSIKEHPRLTFVDVTGSEVSLELIDELKAPARTVYKRGPTPSTSSFVELLKLLKEADETPAAKEASKLSIMKMFFS